MKFIQPIIFFLSCILVSTVVLAVNSQSKRKIDYNRLEKYWQKGNRVKKYLRDAKQSYNNYLKNTKFDNKFKLDVKEQTFGYGSRLSGNILFLINQKLYNPVTVDDIDTYKTDLESEGYSVRIVTSTNKNDPAALRDYLYQEWTHNHIDGAFLIGGLPVAWYEMPIYNEDHTDRTGWDIFPCDLYYMDVDGVFLDKENNNGVWDYHAGNLEPDIWIGRLYTPTMTYYDANQSELVERYLKKHIDIVKVL